MSEAKVQKYDMRLEVIYMKDNLKQLCEKFVLTKKQPIIFPESIKTSYHASDIQVSPDGEIGFRLTYDHQDDKNPFLVFDMGPGGCGGYPVFEVCEASENAIVRLSYADKYENIIDEEYAQIGDFRRGSCKYLGVGLPVPPANPYRYEKYTISESGKYFSPMVQGQQRFVRVQLDQPGSYAVIKRLYFLNTTDTSHHDGYFYCDDERFNKLWYSSTYTVQMAAIKNADAWEVIDGWLAPRKLMKSDDVGLCKQGLEWRDYTFSCDFRIICNPEIASGAGLVLRAKDEKNCLIVCIDSWSMIAVKRRIDGVYKNLYHGQLPFTILCDKTYHIDLTLNMDRLDVVIDGNPVLHLTGIDNDSGTIGFCQPLEKWAVFQHVRVADGDKILFEDHFDNGLNNWSYQKTQKFLADGGKRDRLPWSGDLDWAGRNSYYAFRNIEYMRGALEMLAFHQTPDGFVYATCYPESSVKPVSGDYGYYQSDLFSMWNIVACADYILFTADEAFARKIYDGVRKNIEYLFEYVEGDGLFNQRYETSKGLWSHNLEQIGKYSYHNVLLFDTCKEAAFIARFLGDEAAAQDYDQKAKIIQNAVIKHLYSSNGYLQVSLTDKQACFMGSALALAVGLFEAESDQNKILAYLDKAEFDVGKIVALAIRGFYNINQDQKAYERIITPKGGVDWISALYDDRYPATVWECMKYHRAPEDNLPKGENWGDYSHPDSGMAHILSGFILGIQPIEPGFKRFFCKPHCYGFHMVSGIVPTVMGNIQCEWRKDNERFTLEIEIPDQVTGEIYIPIDSNTKTFNIYLGAQKIYDATTGFADGIAGRQEPGYIVFDMTGGTHQFILQCEEASLIA